MSDRPFLSLFRSQLVAVIDYSVPVNSGGGASTTSGGQMSVSIDSGTVNVDQFCRKATDAVSSVQHSYPEEGMLFKPSGEPATIKIVKSNHPGVPIGRTCSANGSSK